MSNTGKPDMKSLRRLATLRSHPSALLLWVQLGEVALYPLLEHLAVARVLLGFIGIVVLLLTLRMIRHAVGHLRTGLVLAVAAVLLNALWLAGVGALQPWQAGAQALFYFYAAACLVGYMLADQRATRDELYAAGATFTLLVWAFTYLMVLCQVLQPTAFGAVDAASARSWSELMFLSFALLSSTGIGDTLPVTELGRAVASLEMFTGVMYLALVVSRLIGLAVARKQS